MGTNQQHEIVIEIGPDGKITGEVKGVEGPSCTSLTAWLDELGKVVEDRHTADYHKHGKQAITTRR